MFRDGHFDWKIVENETHVNNTLAVKTPMKIVLDITLTKTNDILRRGATIRPHFSTAGATKLDEITTSHCS